MCSSHKTVQIKLGNIVAKPINHCKVQIKQIFHGLGDLGWLGPPLASPASQVTKTLRSQNHEILVILVHYNGLLVFYWYFLVLLVQFFGFSIKRRAGALWCLLGASGLHRISAGPCWADCCGPWKGQSGNFKVLNVLMLFWT